MIGPFVALGAAALLAGLLGKRLGPRPLGWSLLPAPLAAGALWLTLPDGARWGVSWVPAWGVSFGFAMDGLARLFGVLVLGVGALVTVYTGYYFEGEKGAGRFFALLFTFMAAMLGLVAATDLVTLFVCWEATSVLSFLLVGFRREDPAARRAALRALIVTGAGGLALLLGLVGLGLLAGGWEMSRVLAAGANIKNHGSYPVLFGLIALGAFTKSAQVPFHRWLPGAMAAPTPASAYLHSATMVKAGMFLLMRLHPALGGTDLWFWTLSVVGLATLLGGAWRGLAETDIKALLAQSTLSQLGALTLLAGQDTPTAFKALAIGLFAHALYKSSIFMIAGVVDHATGTRDLRRLGGLKHGLTGAAVVGFLAALSLAGFPPMMGFLAKETLFATVSHPGVPGLVSPVLSAGAVLGAALLIAQAARFYLGLFEGPARSEIHPVPTAFWAAAAAPAGLSTLLAVLPEPRFLADLFAQAAAAAYGAPVKVSLALWTGLTVPLYLSIAAVGLGLALAVAERRGRLSPWAERFRWGDRKEAFAVTLFDGAARAATGLQGGRARIYWTVALGAGAALLALAAFTGAAGTWSFPRPFFDGGLRSTALGVVIVGALATLVARGRDAVMALGVSGLGVAAVMALEPAPDVALVQILADLLLVVIFFFALPGLRAGTTPLSKTWPGLLALVWGALGAAMAGWALAERPRFSAVAPYVLDHAKPLAGSRDVVGAIVVEFRGWDTLVEIAVFAAAGLAVGALLADRRSTPADPPSPLLGVAARALVPAALLLALTHAAFGHNRPGDGFTAGVIGALALGFYDVVWGPGAARRHYAWIRPEGFIAAGLGLVLARVLLPAAFGGAPLAPFEWWGREGFSLSGGLLFEMGIFLTVMGAAARMIEAQGAA